MKIEKIKMNGLAYLAIALCLLVLPFCEEDSGNNDFSKEMGSSETGQGGSLARFTVAGDYLYTVDHNSLNVFDISQLDKPVQVNSESVGFGIETIHPRGDMLFLGSQFGMYIYSIEEPERPELLSRYQHIFSCDPVVTDDKYAYVTLHSEDSRCGRTTNELQIVNIEDPRNPYHVISYDMTSPRGLGIQGKKLYLCDDGIKVYDVSKVEDIKLLKHHHIHAQDCIVLENLLLVVGDGGFYQYRHTPDSLYYLSKLEIATE